MADRPTAAPELIWVQTWNVARGDTTRPQARPDWPQLCAKVLDAVFNSGATVRFSGEGTDMGLILGGVAGPQGRVDLPPFEHQAFAVAAISDTATYTELRDRLGRLCVEADVKVMWVAGPGALCVLGAERGT